MPNTTRQPPGASTKTKRLRTDIDEKRGLNTEEHTTPVPKRQRVSRACDSCRLKRDKCDGAHPVCSTCTSLNRTCTYNSNPKKRGVPTGYIRALELLLGLVFNKIPGGEETVLALLKAANLPRRLATTVKDLDESDVFYSSWKNSTVLKEVDKTLMTPEQPEDDHNKRDIASPDYAEAILSAGSLEWHLPEGLWDGTEAASFISPVNPPTNASTARNTTSYTTSDCGTQTLPPVDQIGERPPELLDGSPQVTDLHPRENMHRLHLQLPSKPGPEINIRISYDTLNDNLVAQSSRSRPTVPASVETSSSGLNPSGSNPQTRMTNNNGEVPSSLQAPTASFTAPRESETSRQTFLPGNTISGRPHTVSSNNGTTMLPELPASVHSTTAQHPTAYSNPSIVTFDPFTNVDGYSQSRIAPDLDALFDELASLDGTER